ncbi:MAG: cell wall hydrolase [Caulobacteraceae bacterium]
MRSFFGTRAFARALTLNFGVVLGLVCGATFLAGDAQSRPEHVYAVAAQTGYAKAAAQPQPAPIASPAAPVARVAIAPTRPLNASPRALDCLAAAVYYEARGESAAGRAAVAQVVLNRRRRRDYPNSVCAVVYQGARRGDCQFSFACNGAMREPLERYAWRDARRIAARALAGYVMSAIGKATCFHAADGEAPAGAIRLGGHVFFS